MLFSSKLIPQVISPVNNKLHSHHPRNIWLLEWTEKFFFIFEWIMISYFCPHSRVGLQMEKEHSFMLNTNERRGCENAWAFRQTEKKYLSMISLMKIGWATGYSTTTCCGHSQCCVGDTTHTHNTQSQTLRKTSDWNVNGKENGRPSVRWKNKSTWTLNKMVFHGWRKKIPKHPEMI